MYRAPGRRRLLARQRTRVRFTTDRTRRPIQNSEGEDIREQLLRELLGELTFTLAAYSHRWSCKLGVLA